MSTVAAEALAAQQQHHDDYDDGITPSIQPPQPYRPHSHEYSTIDTMGGRWAAFLGWIPGLTPNRNCKSLP